MTDAGDLQTIELAAERIRVDRIRTEAQRVVIRTETRTVDQVLQSELLRGSVDITRVAINRDVDEAPDTRVVDGVTIIPVMEERIVLHRQLVLKEEIHIRPHTATEVVDLPVTLRHQRAVVERYDAATNAILSQNVLEPKENDHDRL